MDSDVRYVMSVCSLCVQTKKEAERRAKGCSHDVLRNGFISVVISHCKFMCIVHSINLCKDLLQMTSNTNSSIDASKTKHP